MAKDWLCAGNENSLLDIQTVPKYYGDTLPIMKQMS